ARVLNIAGRPIKTICTASDCEAGANTLIWNAMSDTGLRVPNGIYLVEVTARNEDGGQSKALAQVRIGS
ncbi:MAG TPA: FlgD immunoglobulin-like domain containing protein, partial [Armatimonadota bacterium]|nr:FlgD immunoglobulin-like domain containing protein [Armatimonadota bacterium]